MKTNREIIKRLETVEKKFVSIRKTKYVIRDFDGDFFGDCGFDLSQQQFDDWTAWVLRQEPDAEITVLKYNADGGAFLGKTTINSLMEIQNSSALRSE